MKKQSFLFVFTFFATAPIFAEGDFKGGLGQHFADGEQAARGLWRTFQTRACDLGELILAHIDTAQEEADAESVLQKRSMGDSFVDGIDQVEGELKGSVVTPEVVAPEAPKTSWLKKMKDGAIDKAKLVKVHTYDIGTAKWATLNKKQKAAVVAVAAGVVCAGLVYKQYRSNQQMMTEQLEALHNLITATTSKLKNKTASSAVTAIMNMGCWESVVVVNDNEIVINDTFAVTVAQDGQVEVSYC